MRNAELHYSQPDNPGEGQSQKDEPLYSNEALLHALTMYGKKLGPIKNLNLLGGGLENSNYHVEAGTGEYVLRIFEAPDITENSVRFEVSAMEACSQNGVKVPSVIRSDLGEPVSQFKKDKWCIVMRYCEGISNEGKSLPDSVATQLGEEVAKLDAALSNFKDGSLTRQNYAFDLKNFLLLESKASALPHSYDPEIIRSVFEAFRGIQPQFNALPRGLIHNDIALHNVLVDEGGLKAIADFGDLAFSPHIQEIAVVACEFFSSRNFKPHQLTLFIDGYRKHRPVSQIELSMLFELMQARFCAGVVELHNWNAVRGFDEKRQRAIDAHYESLRKLREFGKQEVARLVGYNGEN